jgi:hypothetical protein
MVAAYCARAQVIFFGEGACASALRDSGLDKKSSGSMTSIVGPPTQSLRR